MLFDFSTLFLAKQRGLSNRIYLPTKSQRAKLCMIHLDISKEQNQERERARKDSELEIEILQKNLQEE